MIYLFDIDGTLTPSRLRIDPEFEQFFLEWMKDKKNRVKRQNPIKNSKLFLSTIYSFCLHFIKVLSLSKKRAF